METKSTLDHETVNKLQELIQVNIDSRDGYLEAVEHIDNSAIATAFAELATRRNDQASELSGLVSINLQEPVDHGSVAAAVHRAWIDLRGAIGQGTQAMLEEAERGEDYIKGKYEETLKEVAGSAVTDVLNRQYREIKATHDNVCELRDSFAEKDANEKSHSS